MLLLASVATFSMFMLVQSYRDGLPHSLDAQYSPTLDARCHLPHTLKPEELCACRRAAAKIQEYWIQGDIQETEDCRLVVGNWTFNGDRWLYLTFTVDPLLMGGNASTGAGLWDGTAPENCQNYCPQSSDLAETGICALYVQSNPLPEDDPRCMAKKDPSGCVHYDRPDGTDGLACDDFNKFAAANPEEARDRCLSDPDFRWSSECFAAEVVTWEEWKQWWKEEVCTMFANGDAGGFVDPDYVYEWAGCAERLKASATVAPLEEIPTSEPTTDPESFAAGLGDTSGSPEVEPFGSDPDPQPLTSEDPLPVIPAMETTSADPGPWVDPSEGWQPVGMADVTSGLEGGKSSGFWNALSSAVQAFLQLWK